MLEEHASGADRSRPVLARLLREMRAGETLVVVRLDRLARSVSHLLAVIEQLEASGAHFRSLRDPIDTSTPQGMFSLQVLGAVAQLERALIAERTKAGPSAATRLRIRKPGCRSSLAAGLGMAVKNAAQLLDGFGAAGLAVEVTHRSKRRLFGLAGLAPLREAVAPPRRPMQSRGRGRPPLIAAEQDRPPPLPEPPLTPIERREFDYSQLDIAIAFADETIRNVRRNLDALLAAGTPTAPSESSKPTTADGDGAA